MALRLDNQGFSDALVILGAAGLVIPAFARFRVSPVIGFILVGLLVGPAGLGSLTGSAPWLYYLTISNPESIEPFAEFGIILLLFSIGLELSFKRLWSMKRLVFGTGAAELIGSALIIGTALHFIGQEWAGAMGHPVLFGDVARPELVERLKLHTAKALILTMDDPVLTVRLARRVRALAPDLPIVARARDTAHAAELYRAGVTDAVPETLESSLQLAEAVLVDLGVAMGPVIASIHEKRDELRQEIKAAADMIVEPRIRKAKRTPRAA